MSKQDENDPKIKLTSDYLEVYKQFHELYSGNKEKIWTAFAFVVNFVSSIYILAGLPQLLDDIILNYTKLPENIITAGTLVSIITSILVMYINCLIIHFTSKYLEVIYCQMVLQRQVLNTIGHTLGVSDILIKSVCDLMDTDPVLYKASRTNLTNESIVSILRGFVSIQKRIIIFILIFFVFLLAVATALFFLR